jgi:hypothetical protein
MFVILLKVSLKLMALIELLWFCCVLEFIFCHVQRITIEQIRNDEWFNKDYVPVRLLEYEDVNLDDLNSVFYDPEVGKAFKCYIFFPSTMFAFIDILTCIWFSYA